MRGGVVLKEALREWYKWFFKGKGEKKRYACARVY
jgi:hypothetical protein